MDQHCFLNCDCLFNHSVVSCKGAMNVTTYSIPELLVQKRAELKMSQNAFAEHIGVHFRTVGAWEIRKSVPKAEMYPMLAKVLGLKLYEVEKQCEKGKQDVKNHKTC